MPRVYIKTYGCQMNERDSEQVSQMFIERGYTMTPTEMDADVVLINTCSVRDQAEQKAIGKMGMVNKNVRRHRPHLVTGFMGCMAQSRGGELLDLGKSKVDLVVGTQKYHRVVEYVEQLVRNREERQMDEERFSIVDVAEEEASQNSIRDHILKDGQATAFVSIMQGCNMKCTFCIVPYTRGGERGRPIAEIVEEVRRLADRGVKEVTLLGQIVNLYGRHEFPAVDGKSPFVQLLEGVHGVDGIERIRFTSPHPIGYKKDLIEAFTYLPKLAEHVHLPLQSGSDAILKRMHRPYTTARFEELVAKIREARPGIAVTTDIIVGFPGETEENYLETRALCDRVKFENAFIFRYSKRRGTPAAEMDESIQVSERVKEERNQDLLALVNGHVQAKYAELVGQKVEILCEGPSKTVSTRLMGRTRTNKIVVFDGNPARHVGQIFDVQVSGFENFTLYADAILSD
ncbi:tRNA (N6-isopentenyl adenosine(37)-C2)-methylthiotransferase MiaB [Phragmitibacter flavus]|uniref:tRNA-2-methylthio-N(6)-dimethylallyladenosine synthase n=1 Tax=Phragmitibacter flavus TaxID=2576071 RepID=A0A5R8KK89_9BACT|nr:tRNA (N6-isopentenyl adenosine(37)-C2)-methylthiotransferase MiaB [Phragmitibacter flavus]TLD72712.1 tRNA (N6-isopentenyl adenosine(37)-C2)-methylthiotransferase MiaB [Phragmitibacter flavus]